jgi:hypothetical protein
MLSSGEESAVEESAAPDNEGLTARLASGASSSVMLTSVRRNNDAALWSMTAR